MSRLAGARVLVTRAADDADELVHRLEAEGAEAVLMPCVSTEFIEDNGTRESLAQALDGADWVAFTSRRGVESIGHLGLTVNASTGVAAIGEATAMRARMALGRCELVAAGKTGEDLGRELLGLLETTSDRKHRVVLPTAESGRPELERILTDGGVEVVRIPVYRTTPVSNGGERRDLEAEGIAAVILASPSAAKGLTNQAVVAGAVEIVTIGPTTSAAVREAGLKVAAEASRPSMAAIIEVMK